MKPFGLEAQGPQPWPVRKCDGPAIYVNGEARSQARSDASGNPLKQNPHRAVPMGVLSFGATT